MYKGIKRLTDILVSFIGLILVSPLLILTAAAIKLDSPGPILFKQDRLGLKGRVFKIYKFRSMVVDAEKGGVYETKGDSRVTRIGKIIRKTSIDELPQFINILKGDMSLIGPRPALTYHPWDFSQYTEHQKKMFDVRPGVTGWAQVNGRKDVEWNKRIELNVEYVEKMSFPFDLRILFSTVFKVLRMENNLNINETALSSTSTNDKNDFLKLMYITNNVDIAKIAEKSGVDWIFIDLEINGKEERQGHLDTVISRHHIDDVKKIKNALTKSKLLVRVNPIFEGSKLEINNVIEDGADIVMLPFFKTKEEVEEFVGIVNSKAKVMLLLETPEAVENIDEILEVKGIDYIHIGLNDLHLGYKMKFMFELLADGTVEELCSKIKDRGILYGFGGIARLGQGVLPAEYILSEHARLNSSMVILSRSFLDSNKSNVNDIKVVFEEGVDELRSFESSLKQKDIEYFSNNNELVKNIVQEIVRKKS
jgi:lipopolysaccharide/colanic/teichoic acid biosynthesis glycosyltransferase/2-keto-3-deoxy-L-rhamnonate aldolase RhmA